MALWDFPAIFKAAVGFLLFGQSTQLSLFFKKDSFEASTDRPWLFGKKPAKAFPF